ncbi:MAG: tetratricopeptide repeat protein, partial [Candidatus Calescibacterium sp.]|nr:tetratricopeptide repeat protein [Candidatus Calescibacterium sp.]
MDIKKLEAIVKIEPNNPKHWFNLGIAYIQENRIAEAHKAFEESIKMNPYFAHSQFFAGLLLLFGRDFKNGIKYLEKATTIDDNIYNKLISDHVIKEILINLVKMSLKIIQDQLEFQPNNIENLSTMAKILLYTNSFEASINYFRKIIELRTENWEAYLYLGIAYEGIENYEQALFYLKRAVASNQYLAESYWIMGRIYLKLGNYGLALKNYEKAVELALNNTRYLNSLARLYLILDKNSQAIKTLQLAIDNNPNSKWSYYYLGQCLEKEYNFDMAIEQYEKAINIDPLFTEAKISLAKLYQLNNNTKRAIEILEELSMDSNDAEIFLLLAQFYYSIGNYIKSKELTEKILSIVPDEKNALHLNILSLLNIYKRKEDIADEEYLIKNLEYLYNNNPSDPVISTELFKLYVDKRDFFKAKEVLEKSKISIKDEETAKKIAFIYLEQESYEKFISTVKYYKLFSFDFIMEIISFLREKGSSFLPIFINDIMQIGKDYLKTDEEIRILLLYLEYIYFSNTLQALEFYKQRFSEDVKKRYNLYLFELLIYFSLYSEYKDKKYFDSFIELANGLNIEYENMANIEHLSVFSLKVNVTINFVLMFYFIVIKSQYNLIYKLYEFLLSNTDIESNVLNTALSDLLPIFMDNSYYSEVIQIIDNFKLSQISLLKKIRIEALLLLGKNSDVLREVEEYYEKFSYDSYVEIIKIIANFDIYGDIPEHLVNNLEILVQESNPLAFALYAHFLLKTDNNEAKRYAIRSLEFLYTEKHNLKYSYQMKIVINILAKFFESTYQLSVFLKGMKQLVSKYSDNYTFNYLLAKYLYITEEYIDAELVAKKSLKLTKNSSQLLEAQNLLAKIREEKERYQSFINELEKIDSGISEKIAYVNTLYKKERIEEI